MTAPLSNDLRKRVVLAIEAGESCRSVASRFGVSVSAAVKWSQRYRATGSVAPGKMGGHRKRILEPHRAFIIERINQTSHLTLHGLKDELAARARVWAMDAPSREAVHSACRRAARPLCPSGRTLAASSCRT